MQSDEWAYPSKVDAIQIYYMISMNYMRQHIHLFTPSLALILVVLLLSLTPDVRCEFEEEQAIALLREVYSKLAEAEMAGADIRDASQQLNKALILIKSIDENSLDKEKLLQEALTIIRDVDSMIPTLIDEGRRVAFSRNIYTALTISSIVLIIISSYIFTPRIFWNLWLKARKNWLIKIVADKGRRVRNDRRRS
jgi:hypothetical protein